jgi:hypothetical protein
MKYVPLGSSCGTSVFLQGSERKGPNYPFDWALSNPKFVLKITELCTSNLSSYEIVTKHFFKNRYAHERQHMVSYMEPGHGSYSNTEYRIAFPHEDHKTYADVIETYTRRVERYRNILMNQESEVMYVWSPPGEQRLFDGEPIVQDLEPLNDIAQIIKSYNPQARIRVFTEFEFEFGKEIEHYVIGPCTAYGEVAGKVHDIFQKLQ